LTLAGTVSFLDRHVQATMTDVASASTVSLIDTGTSQTVATTVTNGSGQFVLTFPNGFVPSSTTTYYLEAVKGLSSNLPGNFSARVRTIAKFQSGWTTITNATPNVGITVDRGTTALAIGAALRNGNPTAFNFTSLIGSLAVGSPDLYTPVASMSQSDYSTILGLVNQALANNQDPVAGVALNVSTNTWTQVNQVNQSGSSLSVTSFTPASGTVGTAVTVAGTGFSTTPASNSVKFNGVSAAVTAASATSLTTSVPSGATSGQTTVQVGNLVYLGPIFSVTTVVSGFTPASGSAGVSVTITGSGFDPSTLANNSVTFSGVSATVTAASATSLTATVPTAAVTGPIAVSVDGSTGTSGSNFVVPPSVSSFSPSAGSAGVSVTITGSGFSATPASNSVTFNGVAATVTSASATSLTVTAPTSTNGPIAVTVAGQTGSSSTNFVYSPLLTALYQPLANSGNTILLEGVFGSSATVNFPGGSSAAATVLGGNRLQVTVPAGATAGNLTVTSGGNTSGALPFRSTSFGLGLQQFYQNYDQAFNSVPSIAASSLVTARRGHANVVIGNYLYVVGGINSSDLNSVERATINGDGTLGAFSTVTGVTLVTTRRNFTCAVIGSYLYVIGGTDISELNSVERATINADGTISTFSTVAGATLATARQYHTCAVVGSYLYVVGGVNGSTTLNSVERATIYSDGTISTFATVTGVTLATARYGHISAVIGNYLYVVGGINSTDLNSVERATVNGDGTLGAFSTVASVTLATARRVPTSSVIGNYLYVIGGLNGSSYLATVERATINADGTIGNFSTVTGVALVTGRAGHTNVVIGNYLYVVGGNGGSSLNSVERANLNANGNMGTFSTLGGVTLVAARREFATVVLGNYLYVIGGIGNSGTLNSIERATINADGTIGTYSTQAGTLVSPRNDLACAVIGNYLYVIGGSNAGTGMNSVERATINSDGTIGAFSTVAGVTLVASRGYHTCAVIGSYLYVLAGFTGTSWTPVTSVERATINADGTISTFSTVSGVSLVTWRGAFGSAVIGNYLYAYGGYNGGGLNSVERATINADGTISTFSTVSGVTLTGGWYYMPSAVIGGYLYVGGCAGPGAGVTRAAINSDGTIGNFTAIGSTLVTARYGYGYAVIGNNLYVIGGLSGGNLASVEQAGLQ
jgi:hypothetical protein